MDADFLDEIFTYHAPHGRQQDRYVSIRNAAKEFAKIVLAYTPRCADQAAALRKIREAVMTANASIALETAGDTEQLDSRWEEMNQLGSVTSAQR